MNEPQSTVDRNSSQACERPPSAQFTERTSSNRNQIVDAFHRRYYEGDPESKHTGGLHTETFYHGIETHKCPLDLWIFQEILCEVRPSLIIEIGTYLGGATLFLAHQLEALGSGMVLSIDQRELPRPRHPRIRYLLGESSATTTIEKIQPFVDDTIGPVLVIHDADHHFEAVLADLEIYAPFVTPGSYLIVEDTNVNGHPVLPEWGPGPWEAVEQFLTDYREFERDRSREKFLLTYNPDGYLRRTK